VVFNRKRNRLQPERLVTLLLLLFVLTPLFSQEDDVDTDESALIVVEVSPEKIIVGQRFDLTIFADFSAYRNVIVDEPELPEGIVLVSGPYKSAQTIRVGDIDNPRYIKKTRVFYKYKVTKPGLYTIGSYSLSDGLKSFSTESIMFPVLDYDERDLKYPVFARWNKIPDQIFVGETIPIILEMENLEELSFPERISMDSPVGGMFEKVNSVGEISVTTIADDEVYIAPIESWLYTPTVAGKITIPSASVQYGDINRSTGSKTIEVLKSPDQIESTGAIGNFTVSTYVDNLPMKRGNISTLHIKVEGEGNLNYLQMPQPEFSGVTIIEKDESFHFEPSLAGYTGYREDLYRINIGDEENISITFDDWNWYNRDQQKIEIEELNDYNYRNADSGDQNTNLLLRDKYTLLSIEKILKYKSPVYNVKWYYLLLLPGLVSVLAALIKKRIDMRFLGASLLLILISSSAVLPDSDLIDRLKDSQFEVEKGELGEALFLYDSLIEDYNMNPGLYYNRSLLNYDLENRDKAVFNLRKSLILKPGDRLFYNTLNSVEEEYGLDHQAAASTGLSPDLFFVIFVLLFNTGAAVIVLNIRKRKIELTILIIMIFFLSLLSGITIYYTDFVSKRNTAVVRIEGGELKKVPGSSGGEWLTLQAGTAIYITSESDDSFLIKTGYGLEGWLDRKFLIDVHGGE